MDLQFDFRCLQYFSYLHSGLKRLHSWNTVSDKKKKHLAFNSWTYCYFRQHTVLSSASYQQISWSKWESTSDGWFCWYPSERVVDNQLTVAASSPSDSHTFSLDSLSWYSCHFSCHLSCLFCEGFLVVFRFFFATFLGDFFFRFWPLVVKKERQVVCFHQHRLSYVSKAIVSVLVC